MFSLEIFFELDGYHLVFRKIERFFLIVRSISNLKPQLGKKHIDWYYEKTIIF